MSADYWSVCPNCMRLFDEKYDQASQALEEAYGSVPREEYEKMEREMRQMCDWDEVERRTLAEYHDVGIQDGEFYVNFRASCQQCGWRYQYTVRRKVFCENDS